MPRPPTDRQRQVIATIAAYQRRRGFAPTISEIACRLGITPHAAVGHLNGCERKGLLTRAPGIARGIVLRDPSGSGSRQDLHHVSRLEHDA
jgi:repressor LexA